MVPGRMRGGFSFVLVLALLVGAGCGGSGIEGTLEWQGTPRVSSGELHGTARNTTSHSVTLDSKAWRLLDERGRKVVARIRVGGAAGSTSLDAGASARIDASWKSGKPVRLDYGAGALALPSG